MASDKLNQLVNGVLMMEVGDCHCDLKTLSLLLHILQLLQSQRT